ncbi:Potassium voltage-gated channel subfamily H member 6, partial [Dissostichus eleginoides]
ESATYMSVHEAHSALIDEELSPLGLIHHQKPISERQWEKCGASGSPCIPISGNEKTNNRTWLGIIAEGTVVFADFKRQTKK